MKSINSKLFFLIAVFIIISFGKNEVDLVVINAKIYTVNVEFSIAKSMAIKNGEIIDIDTDNLDSKYNYKKIIDLDGQTICLLYTSPSPRDGLLSRMPSSA